LKTPKRTNQFKKDVKLTKKRGKDMTKLRQVLSNLINERPLNKKLKDHPLKGVYSKYRECHIEPDWLLIYKVENVSITFQRTGTHTDLFD